MPAFKHIRSECIEPGGFILSAHGSKLWTFSVLKDTAGENDILNFVNYCKRQKHKVSKKILIIFKGITPEAKLLAMQEHIWIWPLDKLNRLLNIYGKPRIANL